MCIRDSLYTQAFGRGRSSSGLLCVIVYSAKRPSSRAFQATAIRKHISLVRGVYFIALRNEVY
ncbi:hypothetical protein [uncultured Porphyromonas sp.]|uniref:hypothetical protein n=1 Tax=uncultured Porphyromonas sp. TaxID=159274 RepID=UPI002620BECB|nr:hypothetical protein [uncultured Porphyromonas sp.]